MPSRLRFSFIIPVLDQWKLTRDCLLSWFAHTSEFIDESEILIVDDGSGAETKSQLKKLPSPIRVLENESNLGFAGSNNRAAKEARGQWLVMINNDLVLQRGWLDAMLSAAMGLERPGVIGNIQLNRNTGELDHLGKFFDKGGIPRHFGQLHPEIFPVDPPVDFMEFPSVTAACWMIKKTVFDELGGFSQDYHNGFEDDDLCFRARSAGYSVGVSLRSVVYHYVSSSVGRKSREEENLKIFNDRWGEQVKALHDEHYMQALKTLMTWSIR